MNLAHFQIVRPIPEGRSTIGTIAARFGRLALIYIGIALVGAAATFVLALIGRERTVVGILGAIIGVLVILGVVHATLVSVRILRFLVRELKDSKLSLFRRIAELATWRLGERARYEHELSDVPVMRERVPREETMGRTAGRSPDLEFHTETVHHRRRSWFETGWATVVLVSVFSFEIMHVLDYIRALLPSLSTFAAGLGAGATFGVGFAFILGVLKLFVRKVVK